MGHLYTWLKLLHVLAAIVWMGGFVAMWFLMARLLKAGDLSVLQGYWKAVEAFGGAVMGAASGLTFLLGVIAAIVRHQFVMLWVQLGLALIIVLFVLGGVMVGPAARRLKAALAAPEGDAAAVAAAGHRLVALYRIYLLLLLVAVGVMVLKPV